MALEIGDTLDTKYRIVRVIGVGGMGTVYEGEHTLIRRRVAIKVLAAESASTPDAVQRFRREAQAAGRIGSDHILEVLDVGTTPEGAPFMVMEYLEGETLAARMERVGRLTPGQIAPTARQVLAGLAAAHEAGVIHRDLKPDNVFIMREKAGLRDFVKIIDFGISKFDQANRPPTRLTQTGTVLGTPYYMSPEQARGVSVDARTDLHACGVILFEAVTGQVPFEGANFNELMFQIALGKRPRVRDVAPEVDARFDEIVAKAMERDPKGRYQSAREFASDLEGWMRANSLSTTTGEIVVADIAAILQQGPPSGRISQQMLAAALEAAPESVKRRTVTTASIDAAALPLARRSRRRWLTLAVGTACGLAVAAAALFVRHSSAVTTTNAAGTSAAAGTASASAATAGTSATPPEPAAAPSALASAAAAPPASASASASTSAAPSAEASSRPPDPRRKPRAPRGGPKAAPTATSKQVDFGY